MDENLKKAIIHKLIKAGGDIDGDFVAYDGRLYYVNVMENKVVEQRKYKR